LAKGASSQRTEVRDMVIAADWSTLVCAAPRAPTDLNRTVRMSPPIPPAGYAGGDNSRRHQIFPSLSEEQFAILERYGERRRYPAGAILFRQGERHIPMFVIISGSIEMSASSPLGTHVIAIYGRGQFTGEAGMFAGHAAVATGRAVTDCEVLVIEESALRTLVITEAELSETIMRAFILRRVALIQDQSGGVILIGSQDSDLTLGLREFLARNGQPTAYFDVDQHADSAGLMARFGIGRDDIPAVVTQQGKVLIRPTLRELADATGISPENLHGREFDVVVVGAGPGGLAAAVYAASEGLRVVVFDAEAPGGQAGTSSKIENYFGFPTGISGIALAGRGLSQARKFGAEVAVPFTVTEVVCINGRHGYEIGLDSGERVLARTLVIATGARYRKPALANLERFEGRGVYYNASFMEANFCTSEEVVVVGGGNSAGQAAVFLSRYARKVHVVVRGPGLAASMSHYLVQRIEAAANITLHTRTQVVALEGGAHLEQVWIQHQGEPPRALAVRHVFLFLGAEPNTAWLGDCVALDARQFVLTGPWLARNEWPLERDPHFLETSCPGIFAVGDVRSGSVKRVAAAVGEGAAAVQSLHQVLSG
jgi:thioredoxin reductase (NADPH)